MRLNCLTSMRAAVVAALLPIYARFSMNSLHVFDSLDALVERDVELSRDFLLLSRLQIEEALDQIAVCTQRSGSSSSNNSRTDKSDEHTARQWCSEAMRQLLAVARICSNR